MKRRIAVIDYELCKPDKCGNYLCIRVCPKVRSGEECIVVNEKTKKPIIDENICIGCGICVKKCPFKAITIVNLPEQLKEDPVHRYGVNDFALFRLPFPVEDKVVGLLGPNGVGKTTALLILSGKIKPNLGRVGEEVEFKDFIKLFRGTELQSYLEKLENGEVKVSLKPQRVDRIPDHAKGKVSKLLEKVDERGIMVDLVERLGISHTLDRDISTLSGGELQRVAIVATLCKDADIYYFDEPSSFLDVFQRLKTAKVIREFTQGKSVMVVDHDLAMMDFLADRIHVFYGVPGVYGIVSKPYGVRVGINIFLDGYIKEDNVRIRPEPIRFESFLAKRFEGKEVLVSFNNIQKTLGNFSLTVESGEIYAKEVLGVMGANALGKTTFARILAKQIEPDAGKVEGDVKISYKPQYPKLEYDGIVEEFLNEKCESFGTTEFSTNIAKPLQLEKLMEKRITTLSGGEFQRVMIANCLGQEADLYILDEPSAYLDVEQRLSLAKVIRKFVEVKEVSAFVIDHDILFLSQISSRGMVFVGVPGKKGKGEKPTDVQTAMNRFLKEVD
ncbi:MAG: ribosome biogenesis/translation initiation ATPase RLI, partial [Candidatus Aenigmarchaeota archaeon]|nr:ribosome biogenesis/translation initiation ATPase RLI [Candidatus Aenigmarchaeota archaeon]